MSGVVGDIQDYANEVFDAAQQIGNATLNLGQAEAQRALGVVLAANKALLDAVEKLSEAAVGK